MTEREQCIVILKYMVSSNENHSFILTFDEHLYNRDYDNAIIYFLALKEFDRITAKGYKKEINK